jgi:hypothetical protein
MSQTAVNPVRERPGKSLGLAVALAFLFGPFGLAYASLTGALVMLVVSGVVLVPVLLGIFINAVIFLPVWIVCVIWAVFATYGRASSGSVRDAEAPGDGAPGGG